VSSTREVAFEREQQGKCVLVAAAGNPADLGFGHEVDDGVAPLRDGRARGVGQRDSVHRPG
jgi:hypothetical protein